MDVTAYKMKEEVDESALRLLFLLDYAIMPRKYDLGPVDEV